MKLKYSLFMLIITNIVFVHLTAQKLDFETTFWIEDAQGNRDSVIVGFDESANNMFNPELGEVNIEEPFDSVLEVRAGHLWSYSISDPLIQSKKIVEELKGPEFGPERCLVGHGSVILYINAKYQPIQITWDSTQFKSHCLRGSLLANHNFAYIISEWFNDAAALSHSVCLAESSKKYFRLFDFAEWGNIRLEKIAGSAHQKDTLFPLFFTFSEIAPLSSPCGYTVNIETPHKQPFSLIKGNILTGSELEFSSEMSAMEGICTILSISGQNYINRRMAGPSSLDCSHLPSGHYYIIWHTPNGTILSDRFIRL